jgi:hypothetical protein
MTKIEQKGKDMKYDEELKQ